MSEVLMIRAELRGEFNFKMVKISVLNKNLTVQGINKHVNRMGSKMF